MKMQPRITEIAHELVDAMLGRGAPVDLRAALGFPLPVYVIRALLGVPAADREKFASWSDHFLNITRYTEDGRMTEHELVFTAQGLLIAGHETTANMIGKMTAMLLSDSARWEQLLADPAGELRRVEGLLVGGLEEVPVRR